ncbi:iron-containing alcohol dehydrogenase [Mucilaginibacter sp.]|uniref:iron-containing alcohol dehydrogenase n=1 Tax=Mucilaginibacter sp. TaxID=1882438 RepID=UPI0026121974|nr:iron-containing alcohol dehydrogenase [Mucilaginibacter sp.]MDB4919542.1 alcohol dehydrogenase [Mucilaginibacter sp.]
MSNTNIIPHFSIQFPGRLIFGNGSLAGLPEEIIKAGCKKVLVITIEPLLSGLANVIRGFEANGTAVSINTQIMQEPSFKDFEALMVEAKSINPDMVIGIGGGSVLDVAKLVAAQLDNTQTLAEIVGIGLLKGRNTKLICVPATSGTGSEVSPNVILIDDSDHQKKGIISPYLVPDIVYVDPLLTITVPPAITAATGLDALTHCLEAYTNKFALPFIDLYAYEGMRLIAANLVNAVINGADEEARAQVAMGSLLGGFCLGPVNTAGVHALSYPLGSTFHLPHGLSNALLLPYVMEYNMVVATVRYADVAVALGCKRENNDEETAKKGIEKIRELIAQCGIPARLRDVDIPKDAIPTMAKDALKMQRLLKNNPRNISEANAIDIYTQAY